MTGGDVRVGVRERVLALRGASRVGRRAMRTLPQTATSPALAGTVAARPTKNAS